MSHQLTAVLNSNNLPTAADLNQEFERLGLPCSVTGDLSLGDDHGEFTALVSTLGVERSIHFENASFWFDEIPELRRLAAGRDRVVDFPLGSDMAESFLVSAICATLAARSSALIYYAPDDLYYSVAEIADEARSALRMIE